MEHYLLYLPPVANPSHNPHCPLGLLFHNPLLPLGQTEEAAAALLWTQQGECS